MGDIRPVHGVLLGGTGPQLASGASRTCSPGGIETTSIVIQLSNEQGVEP